MGASDKTTSLWENGKKPIPKDAVPAPGAVNME
jgi:hypothetical protein